MAKVETNARKIIARLQAEGWTSTGGGSHDRFINLKHPGTMIVVPRHQS